MSFRPNQPSPAQRVMAALHNVNQPINCPKCGSMFMFELKAQMYTSASSGLRSVSTLPMTGYLCLCGELFVPNVGGGAPAGSERDAFATALKAAAEHRAEYSPDALARAVPSLGEFRALQEQVNRLTELVNGLSGEQLATLDIPDDQAEEEEQVEPVNPVLADEKHEQTTLVPSGNRGRSAVSATPASGDIKQVELEGRPVTGNARQVLKRQGGR